MFVKTTKLTDTSLFSRFWKNSLRQKDLSRWMKMSYTFITGLMASILIISIVLSVVMCIRMLVLSPVETVGTWKTLKDESIV